MISGESSTIAFIRLSKYQYIHSDSDVSSDYAAVHSHTAALEVIEAGKCDAVVMWWTLHMYEDIELSTAPGQSSHMMHILVLKAMHCCRLG